jgi:hypothetical protein
MTRTRPTKDMVVSVLIMLLLNVCGGTLKLSGQASSNKDSGLTFADISGELRDQFGTVRFHREEEFEDRFIVSGLSAENLGLAPHVYQIQSPRFDHAGGSVLVRTGNGLPTMYVATLSNEHRVYRLYGFANAEQDFNRLVSDAPSQRIIGTGDAESRGLLCGEIVYGLSSRWWVADESNAKLQAAEHFFAEGHKDGLLLGEKWWKSVKGDRTAISISTKEKEGGGFVVNLPVFWAPVEGDIVPQIKIYHIEVSEVGTCHMNSEPAQVLK